MNWLEILWLYFWDALLMRRHERPACGGVIRLPELARMGEAAWIQTTDMAFPSTECGPLSTEAR